MELTTKRIWIIHSINFSLAIIVIILASVEIIPYWIGVIFFGNFLFFRVIVLRTKQRKSFEERKHKKEEEEFDKLLDD